MAVSQALFLSLSQPFSGLTAHEPPSCIHPSQDRRAGQLLDRFGILEQPLEKGESGDGRMVSLCGFPLLALAVLSGDSCYRSRAHLMIAQLASNPHVVLPSRKDLLPSPPAFKPLFVPRPLAFASAVILATTPLDEDSVDRIDALSKGMYSLSLRGVKKGLSKSLKADESLQGPIATFLQVAERELQLWLRSQIAGEFHSSSAVGGKVLLRDAEENMEIVELSRAPHAVRWVVEDRYHRFLLHCLARYYNLNSFSSPAPPGSSFSRITHISRPQINRPRPSGVAGWELDTPPGTDLSASELSGWGGSSVDGDEIEASSESDWEEVERPPIAAPNDNTGLVTPSRLPFAPFIAATPSPTSRTPTQAGSQTPTPTRRPTRATFPPSGSTLRRATSDTSSHSRSPARAVLARGSERKRRTTEPAWEIPSRAFLQFLLD